MPSLSLKLIITYTTITQPTMVAVITPMSRMVIRHLKTAETAFRVWRTAGFFITARHFPDLRESAICLASLLFKIPGDPAVCYDRREPAARTG